MKNDKFELAVKVNGSKIPEYGSRGRTYVRGEENKEFTLQFYNRSASRVLVVFSVDGLSVLDGKTADVESGGYICNAYGTVEVHGWRTSTEETRKFFFTKKTGSYAGKTNDVTNCGVLGCMVFSEKLPLQAPVQIIEKHIHHNHPTYVYPPWNSWPDHPRPIWYYDPTPIFTCGGGNFTGGVTGNSAVNCTLTNDGGLVATYQCSAGTPELSGGPAVTMNASNNMSLTASNASEITDYTMGTGFGEVKQDSIRIVTFEKDVLIATLELYYTEKAVLEKAGIQVDRVPEVGVKHPQAFSGFCVPPK